MARDPLLDEFLGGSAGGAEEDDPLVREFLGMAPVDPEGPPPGPPPDLGDSWDWGGIARELPGAVVETLKTVPKRGAGYLMGVVDIPTHPLRQASEEVAEIEGLRPEGAGSWKHDFYRAFGVAPELEEGAGAVPFGDQLVSILGVNEGAYGADEVTVGRALQKVLPGMWIMPQNVRDSLTRGAAQLVGGVLEDPTALAGLLSGKVIMKPGIAKLNDLVQTGLGVAALPGIGISGLDAFGKAKDALVAGDYAKATQFVFEGIGAMGLAGLITLGIRDGENARARRGTTEPPLEPALPPTEVPPADPAGITPGEMIARELPAAQAPRVRPRSGIEIAEAITDGMDAEMLGATSSPLDLARAVMDETLPLDDAGKGTLHQAFMEQLRKAPAESQIREIGIIQAANEKVLFAGVESLNRMAAAAEEGGKVEGVEGGEGAPPGGPPVERLGERRTETQPVEVERRLAERRAKLAEETGLAEDHPAVQRLMDNYTDPGTGIGNRAHWDELARGLTPDDTVGFVDLSGFKNVNDTLGHEQGNSVLRQVATVLQQHFGDDLARWGGDEFAVALRGAPLDAALAKLEVARAALKGTVFHLIDVDGKPLDYSGIDAHLGVGKDLNAADLAANESRGAKGRGSVAAGVPAEPGAAGRAAGGAPEGGAVGERGDGVPGEPPGGPPAEPVPGEPTAGGTGGAALVPDPDTARAVADGQPAIGPAPSPELMQAANEAAASLAARNVSAARAQAPPTAGNLAMKLDPAEQAPPPRGPGEPPGAPSPYDPPDLTEPILRGAIHRDTVDAVGEAMQDAGIAWNQKRFPVLSDQIAMMVRDGTLPLQTLVARLDAHGLKLVQFMDELWRPAVTDAAKRLNALSQLSKDLAKLAREQGAPKGVVDAVDQAMADVGAGLDGMALARSWWRRLENVRRGLLVTQLSTVMRNLETQVVRTGVGAITDALDYAIQRSLRGMGADIKVTAHPLDGFLITSTAVRSLATFGKGTTARRTKALSEALLGGTRGDKFVEGLFDARFHDRLFMHFASDVSTLARDGGVVLKGADKVFTGLERAANWLNTLNRGQEWIFRNAVLVTRLDSELKAKGAGDLATTITQHNRLVKEMEGRDPNWKNNQELLKAFQADSRNLYSKVDGKMLDRAIDAALEMTFAESPKYGTVGQKVISAVNGIPPLTLILPFPRFMWNSLKFLWQYNPTGFLNLLSPAERAKLATGDTRTISKAVAGTAMLFAAYQVRSSDNAGERWYEIKVGKRNVDIRPFNPFAAHFFVADILLRWKEKRLYSLTSQDVLAGILSTNLRAGTGLALVDNFVKQATSLGSADEIVKALGRLGGEYLAGFMTPLQQLADGYAQFAAFLDPSVQVVRDRRQSPFLAPIVSRIPGGSQDLPELELPTRAGPARNEFPLVKQLTGLLISDPKNPLESELQRLQFAPNEIFRGTRDPEYDALTKHYMGIFAEELGVPLVQSAEYQALSEAEKGLMLAEVLKTARKSARALAKAERPDLYVELRRKSPRQRIFEADLEDEAEEEMSGSPDVPGAPDMPGAPDLPGMPDLSSPPGSPFEED